MKIAFAIFTLMIILIVSCTKSDNQPNTNPILTDTLKPSVTKVDTSTLVKSRWIYYYDASGTVITDSTYDSLIYDNQRRYIQWSTANFKANHFDTVGWTFLSNRTLYSYRQYDKGSPEILSNATYYLNAKNLIDSMILTSKTFGVSAGQDAYAYKYYYYNKANQDSLEKESQGQYNGGPPYNSTLNYYYTGSNLDSTIDHDNLNEIDQVNYYSNGNNTAVKWYFGGVQAGIEQFTFSTIPSSGLYVLHANNELESGYTSVTIPANPSSSYTGVETYQIDSANRVRVRTLAVNGVLNEKDVYTYY
jgi:hypothetical protein